MKIEKYFSGETTKKEELELIQYFSSENIDPELIQYKNYFCGLAKLKNNAKEIILEEEYEDFTPSLKNRTYYMKRWGIGMAVAATVALLILLFPFLHKNSDYVVINGKKYLDKKHIELALNASLENVKLDVKQIFDDFDEDLFN
jgi:hypothetical protein